MLINPRAITVSALLVLLLTRTASAEDSVAETLFRQGREAIVNGATEKGCALLAESDRLEPSPGAKLGLGLCEEQLGHYARAWVLLQKVIQTLPPSDERVPIAERHAADIKPRLAFVTVALNGMHPPAIQIMSDMVELTSADVGVPLPFDPGSHFFQISAPDREPRRVDLMLHAGEQHRVELLLEPSPPASVVRAAPAVPLALPPAPPPNSALRSAGFILEGAAAALLVTSVTTGVLALKAKDEMNQACDAEGCSEAGLRAAARGDAFAATSTGTFIGALASGGIGALFLVLGALRNPHHAPPPSAGNLRVYF
jgi:hypothetical protein